MYLLRRGPCRFDIHARVLRLIGKRNSDDRRAMYVRTQPIVPCCVPVRRPRSTRANVIPRPPRREINISELFPVPICSHDVPRRSELRSDRPETWAQHVANRVCGRYFIRHDSPEKRLMGSSPISELNSVHYIVKRSNSRLKWYRTYTVTDTVNDYFQRVRLSPMSLQ